MLKFSGGCKVLRRFMVGGLWGLALAISKSSVTEAAELISIDYGLLSRTIPVTSLETFVETGVADEHISFYLERLEPAEQERVKAALSASRSADVNRLTNWYNTPLGEQMLTFTGAIAQTGARLNGQQALRAALIASAAEDGEITLVDVVQNFPTPAVRLDLARLVAEAQSVIDAADTTTELIGQLTQQSLDSAAQDALLDLDQLPNLTQTGPFGTRQINLNLQDTTRGRLVPAELFLPQDLSALSFTFPVIVLSHGLGGNRSSNLDMAAHVASYGFAVAAIEHVGSNTAQFEAMWAGLEPESFKAKDFWDRPLDVSFLLDELERRNLSDFQGRLNLEQVAAVGTSFGGYTVLALAGATIDFQELTERCEGESNFVLNAGQLLECRSLELSSDPETVNQLGLQGVRDDRIQLVIAHAPVARLFGQQGISRIDIPVVMFGGEFDILAPLVPQQVETFSWLTTSDKYLYLGENTSHNADLTRLTSRLFNIDRDFEQGVEEGLALSQDLFESLLIAFSKVYLLDDAAYEPFLRAAYVETVSEDPFKKHLVRELPPGWNQP